MIGIIEVIFALALIWVIFAVVQDLKSREIANWLNFSLIIFVLALRLFWSLFTNDFRWIIFGLVGLGVFFVLANIFYYGRLFAGGDAKLFIAFGTIVPISLSWLENTVIAMIFVLALLLFGGIYSIIYSGFLAHKNKKKFSQEFFKQFRLNRGILFICLGIAFIIAFFILVLGGASSLLLFLLALIILLMPLLYVYTKAVEQSSMIKSVVVDKLTVGDWLVNDIEVNGRKIEAKWDGLGEEDLDYLKKHYKKEVLVKYGVPFSPAFLFALIALIIVSYIGVYKLLMMFY